MTLNFFGGGGFSRKTIFSFELKTLGEKVGYCQSHLLYYLELAIVFVDECNPSKIFKMASNSFEVTDVPF